MDFEWDGAKAAANKSTHRVDFETAARVFLDPYVQERQDDSDPSEQRLNAIGMVDGRLLFVVFTMRGNAYRIISARGAKTMKRGNITKFKLDPKRQPKTDWAAFDAMTARERNAAAKSDPDFPILTAAQLRQFRRRVDVRALRQKLDLTQEEFAAKFNLPLGTIRDWEQGTHRPDRAAQILLRVIASEPDAVVRALGRG